MYYPLDIEKMIVELKEQYKVRDEFLQRICPMVKEIYNEGLTERQSRFFRGLIEESFKSESEIIENKEEGYEIINQVRSYATQNYSELVRLRDSLVLLQDVLQKVKLMKYKPEVATYH
ncbi:hypothetical protein ACFL4G_05665 [Thermodesulfobacteriota bacterium]